MNWFAKRLMIHSATALFLGPLGPVVGETLGQVVDMIDEIDI